MIQRNPSAPASEFLGETWEKGICIWRYIWRYIGGGFKLYGSIIVRLHEKNTWMFPKIVGTPKFKSSILIGFSHYKPYILGYPYFWKHPYKLPSREGSHIPPAEVRKIIDSKVPTGMGYLLVPWRVPIWVSSNNPNV